MRDEARKAKVIANVVALADDAGIPRVLVERLVEGSIAYELECFDGR